jgi:hypothetical protein
MPNDKCHCLSSSHPLLFYLDDVQASTSMFMKEGSLLGYSKGTRTKKGNLAEKEETGTWKQVATCLHTIVNRVISFCV